MECPIPGTHGRLANTYCLWYLLGTIKPCHGISVRPVSSIRHIIQPAFHLILAGVLWTLAGCPDSAQEIPVLAVVNEKAITQREFDLRWAELPPGLRERYDREGGKAKFLDDLIARELLMQEARRRGVDRSASLRERMEMVKEQMILDDLTQQVLGPASEVSDAELDAYLALHRELLPPDTEIRAAHIVVDSRALARELKRQLDRGSDFGKLAMRFSLDKATRGQGGDLGVYRPGFVPPEIESTILRLKAGMISDPIKTEGGYQLIKVLRREIPDPGLLQALREQLRRELHAEKRLKQYAEFLAGLRATAMIRKES
jgi:peptidyl-prolyl cis-trans isomerase C